MVKDNSSSTINIRKLRTRESSKLQIKVLKTPDKNNSFFDHFNIFKKVFNIPIDGKL